MQAHRARAGTGTDLRGPLPSSPAVLSQARLPVRDDALTRARSGEFLLGLHSPSAGHSPVTAEMDQMLDFPQQKVGPGLHSRVGSPSESRGPRRAGEGDPISAASPWRHRAPRTAVPEPSPRSPCVLSFQGDHTCSVSCQKQVRLRHALPTEGLGSRLWGSTWTLKSEATS